MTRQTVRADDFTAWSDAHYPRPRLCRPTWVDLNGSWEFAADPDDRGRADEWFRGDAPWRETVQVPFTPGCAASGVTLPDAADVVWYRRILTAEEIASGSNGDGNSANREHDTGLAANREPDTAVTVLHFEAVDYRTDVWIDGSHCGSHEGGFTPFSVRVPRGAGPAVLVVRAEDRRADLSLPRGKQDWREQTHSIWYERAIGIWRDVWMEQVPAAHIEDLAWTCDITAAEVRCAVTFSDWLPAGSQVSVDLTLNGMTVASVSASVSTQHAEVAIAVPALRNRMEWPDLLWAPDHPNLVNARVRLDAGEDTDEVVSYLGMTSVRAAGSYLWLNDKPIYVRGVLDQGYWAESRLTPPTPEALAEDVRLARSLGFNTLRVHQRVPDRRLLTWADRLGMMTWAEFPAAFEFSPRAMRRTITEWLAAMRRDLSHPCIVAWVPFNESWGVPAVSVDPQQQAFVDAVVSLTRSVDPTRPVIANDGWEQRDTDVVTVHDYGSTGAALAINYADADAVAETVHGAGPQGRTILAGDDWAGDRPVIVSEFGGVLFSSEASDSWGYSTVADAEEFDRRLTELFGALRSSPLLAGHCYTQLTDTRQEANGLCTADRTPKLPSAQIRDIVIGSESEFAGQRRPRAIHERHAKGH